MVRKFFDDINTLLQKIGREVFDLKLKCCTEFKEDCSEERGLLLDQIKNCGDLVSLSLFDKMRGHCDLPKLAQAKNLSELVIYPVFSTDLFIMAVREVTFKKLLTLNLGILMITEEELNLLLEAVTEACPKL